MKHPLLYISVFLLFPWVVAYSQESATPPAPQKPPASSQPVITITHQTWLALTKQENMTNALKPLTNLEERLKFVNKSIAGYLMLRTDPNTKLISIDPLIDIQRADCAAAPKSCLDTDLLRALCLDFKEGHHFGLERRIWANLLQTPKSDAEAFPLIQTLHNCSSTPTPSQFLGFSVLLTNAAKKEWNDTEVSTVKKILNIWSTTPQNFITYWSLLNDTIVRLRVPPQPALALKYIMKLSLRWTTNSNYALIPKNLLNDWVGSMADVFGSIGSTSDWEQFVNSHPELVDGSNIRLTMDIIGSLCLQWRDAGDVPKCAKKLSALKKIPSLAANPDVLTQITIDEAFNERALGNIQTFESKIKTLINEQGQNKGRLPWLYANLAVAKIDLNSPSEARAAIEQAVTFAKQWPEPNETFSLFIERLLVSVLQIEGKNKEAISQAEALKNKFSKQYIGPTMPQLSLTFYQLLAAISSKDTTAVNRYDKELQALFRRISTLPPMQHLTYALLKSFRGQSPTEDLAAAQKLLGELNPDFKKVKSMISQIQSERPQSGAR